MSSSTSFTAPPIINPSSSHTPGQLQVPPEGADYPGKRLGIAGFILAFTMLHIVGLIVSIIARNKSKEAGYKNTFAFAGIVLNSVFMALIVTTTAIILIVSIASYNTVMNSVTTSFGKSTAEVVVKHVEQYKKDTGSYPVSFSEMKQYNSYNDATATSEKITSAPTNPFTIEFWECGSAGSKIGYWDEASSSVAYMYAGEATNTSTCTVSN